MQETVNAVEAHSALSENIQHKAHEFWRLDPTTTASLEPVINRAKSK